MVQKSKWLVGAAPDEPASLAARTALEVRLELVKHYLEQAAETNPHPEVVHQLRVATRRASATLAGYESFVPRQRGRWMKRQMRQLRRAASDARDFDVLTERLEPRVEGDASWHSLLERVFELRRAAQQPIEEIARRLRDKQLGRRIDKLLHKVAWRDNEQEEPTFAALARVRLDVLAEPFFAAAHGSLDGVEALHTFRLHGKRVRYAIEVFAAALGVALRTEVYPLIEELQQRLGEVNDRAAAIERYQVWSNEWTDAELLAPLRQLLLEERAALISTQEAFADWWTGDRAADLQSRFQAVVHATAAGQVA